MVVDGHYEIKSKLGAGGMGSVYLVHQSGTDTAVVMKVLTSVGASEEESLERFRREIVLSAKLDHPNIVAAKAAGKLEDGRLYMIMELLPGVSLSDEIKKAPLSPWRARNIIAQVAAGLEHAHSRGIVHRDIKPSNIMLVPHPAGEEDDEIAKIVDFGIARMVLPDDSAVGRTTSSGVIIGTIAYMSPEQCRGPQVDHRADIYSLGCTLHAALSGHPPFKGDSGPALMVHHLYDDPPALPAKVLKKDPVIGDIIQKAMEKEPDKRFANCAEFRDALAASKGTLDIVEMIARKLAQARRGGARRWVVGASFLVALAVPVALWAGYEYCGLSLDVATKRAICQQVLSNPDNSNPDTVVKKIEALTALGTTWMHSLKHQNAIAPLDEAKHFLAQQLEELREPLKTKAQDSQMQALYDSHNPATPRAFDELSKLSRVYCQKVLQYADICLAEAALLQESGKIDDARLDIDDAVQSLLAGSDWSTGQRLNDLTLEIGERLVKCFRSLSNIARSPDEGGPNLSEEMHRKLAAFLTKLATSYLQSSQTERALALYDAALQVKMKPVQRLETMVSQAGALSIHGEKQKALNLVAKARAGYELMSPDMRQVNFVITAANACLSMEDWPDFEYFVGAYRRLLAHPSSAPYRPMFASLLLSWKMLRLEKTGDYQQALAVNDDLLAYVRSAKLRQPDKIMDAYDKRGLLLSRLERHAEAAQAYLQAEKTYADLNMDMLLGARVKLLNSAAAEYFAAGKQEEKRLCLRQALALIGKLPPDQLIEYGAAVSNVKTACTQEKISAGR